MYRIEFNRNDRIIFKFGIKLHTQISGTAITRRPRRFVQPLEDHHSQKQPTPSRAYSHICMQISHTGTPTLLIVFVTI